MVVSVLLLSCVVCDNMGVCHVMLSQLDAAEEALPQSLRFYTTIFPQGHIRISSSEIIKISYGKSSHPCCFCSSTRITQSEAVEI